MREETITADRLISFSDAVFAVIVTVMVLELKAPDQPTFSALWPLWPTAVSYAVSYLFIAIIWINHHHLMRFVGPPTQGLIWINFVHLFMVSLLPFATAWVAQTRLALIAGSLLRRCFRVRRHCLQHLRAASASPCRFHVRYRKHAAHCEAPIAYRPCKLYDGYAGRVRRASRWFRSDLRCLGPSFTTRGFRFHKSMTTSRIGCEQQTRTFPMAGLSSGSGS